MPPSGVPTISPQSLERRIAAGEPLLLLDTRDPATHAGFPFDAPRPVEPLNLPYDRFLQGIDARLGDLKRTTLSGLSPDADVFSRSLLAALPEQPPNFDGIRAANRGVPTPEPSELEYGPNRCAVTGGIQ